jgi:hypothetical protein
MVYKQGPMQWGYVYRPYRPAMAFALMMSRMRSLGTSREFV